MNLFLGGPLFMTGMAQKLSILDRKWPNMADLSTFKSGPKRAQKGPKWLTQVCLTIWDPFGPFQTKSNQVNSANLLFEF